MERRQKERYERHLLGDASSSETEDDPDRTEAEDAEYAQWQKAQRAAQSGSGTAPTMPATVNLSVTHAGPPPAAVAAASKDPRMWTPSDVTQLSAMLSASASAASPTKKRVTFSADTKGGAGPAAASVKQTPPTEDSTPTTAPLGLVVRERPSASKPVPPSVQQAQLDRRAVRIGSMRCLLENSKFARSQIGSSRLHSQLQARHAELFQQFYRPQSDDDFDEEEDDEDEDGYDETGEYGDEDEGDGDGGAAEVAAIAAPQLSRASPGGALSVMGNVAERETGDAQQPRRELVKPVKVSLFMRQQLQAAGAGKK